MVEIVKREAARPWWAILFAPAYHIELKTRLSAPEIINRLRENIGEFSVWGSQKPFAGGASGDQFDIRRMTQWSLRLSGRVEPNTDGAIITITSHQGEMAGRIALLSRVLGSLFIAIIIIYWITEPSALSWHPLLWILGFAGLMILWAISNYAVFLWNESWSLTELKAILRDNPPA